MFELVCDIFYLSKLKFFTKEYMSLAAGSETVQNRTFSRYCKVG